MKTRKECHPGKYYERCWSKSLASTHTEKKEDFTRNNLGGKKKPSSEDTGLQDGGSLRLSRVGSASHTYERFSEDISGLSEGGGGSSFCLLIQISIWWASAVNKASAGDGWCQRWMPFLPRERKTWQMLNIIYDDVCDLLSLEWLELAKLGYTKSKYLRNSKKLVRPGYIYLITFVITLQNVSSNET